MLEKKLTVSSSPHLKSPVTTRSIMLDVVIALMPALVASVMIFGVRSLLLTLCCAAACVVFEYLYALLLKKPQTVGDFSAVVTGVLLAFNLPVTLPLWMAIIGCFVAIVIVKQLFGGIGQNFVNPALVGRIVLMISFPAQMTYWVAPGSGADAVSSATPLAVLSGAEGTMPELAELLFGLRGGCLGETCILALLLGGVYLVLRKVISPVIPLCYLGTVAALTALGGAYPLYQLLSGGLVLGAVFMATDYTTSPLTTKGRIVYAVGCGLITCLIRLFGSMTEGVSFSIILMNLVVPYLDKLFPSKPFGGKPKEKREKGAAA